MINVDNEMIDINFIVYLFVYFIYLFENHKIQKKAARYKCKVEYKTKKKCFHFVY